MGARVVRSRTGFTLMEMIITVAIIAIVASVAIPQYTRAVERSYWRTARNILQAIYSGEQVYEAANGSYVDADNPGFCDGVARPPIWRCIYMDDPNTATIPVNYIVLGVTATTFTAIAAHTQTGQWQSFDESRTWGGTWAMP